MAPRVGVVAIGRNEGARLGLCLDSLAGLDLPVVYVDSGSTDGSADRVRRRGIDVVELDPATPFSAGRARNEGLSALLARWPALEIVQFVDGDCELISGWMAQGVTTLDGEPRVAAACGRVRELHRERSIYNRLCDLEWDVPPGEARSCGGNAMVRVRAFQEVGGFAPSLIAGEEPELCLRLRRGGWRILCVAGDMVRHDAAMMQFGQWWRRASRAGWAYAEGSSLHGRSPDRHWVRENRSIFFWGMLVPASALLLAGPTHGLSFLLLAGFPLLAARIYLRAVQGGRERRDARLLAVFTVLAKLPQALGQAQFFLGRRLDKRRRLADWRTAR
jgi:GT2 family glycosyltransferase